MLYGPEWMWYNDKFGFKSLDNWILVDIYIFCSLDHTCFLFALIK